MASAMNVIGEVKPTDLLRSDWLRLLWGILWRGVCLAALSGLGGALAGALVGFVVGALAAAAGFAPEEYAVSLQILAGLLGLAISCWSLTLYIRWLLRARFGSLRLALVRTPT